MKRSIWAVVAGFLFIGVLSTGTAAIMHAISPKLFNANGGTTNFAVLCVMTISVGVFAIVGCYLTARLAPAHPMKHALILGAIGLILNIVVTTSTWKLFPAWYNVLNLLLVMPYAWFGGRLRENEVGGSASMPSNAAMA